jgi:hypothetical protein
MRCVRLALFCATAVLLTAGLAACPSDPPSNGTVYFLVANPEEPEKGSYVLPLTDPADIAHARAVIADPAGTDGHIVVASLARGGVDLPYQNRDLLNDGKLWSWRIDAFQSFADNTIEILDGWPQFIEDDVEGWFQNTGGQIGFWSARVLREVSLEEMAGPGE